MISSWSLCSLPLGGSQDTHKASVANSPSGRERSERERKATVCNKRLPRGSPRPPKGVNYPLTLEASIARTQAAIDRLNEALYFSGV
jgi:hypothetical protein